MSKMFDTHHILPKSRWGARNEVNEMYVKKNRHHAFHDFFQNQTFPEQVKTLLDWSWQALSERATVQIARAIREEDIQYWYKREAVKRIVNQK